MTLLAQVLHWAAIVSCGLIVVLCVVAWSAMSGKTRHCFRFVYGLIGACAFVLMLPGVFAKTVLAPLAFPGIFIGFALYMLLDRRRIRPGQFADSARTDSARAAPTNRPPFVWRMGGFAYTEAVGALVAMILLGAVLASHDARGADYGDQAAVPAESSGSAP